MLVLLALVPALPLVGFSILFVTAGLLPKRWIAVIGVGSVGIAMMLALIIMVAFLSEPEPRPFTEIVWTWIAVDGLTPQVGFYLDALSLIMMVVVTFVGFLIHLYSAEFMSQEEGYSRYFAYMNLFVASMLVLILADNLLLLYLGWEGVGLCSYLLIGFWYRDPANGLAARKAFVITRVGDTAMAIGLFLLFTDLGTLEIQPLMQRAAQVWPAGAGPAIAAAGLLLGGALGKSAQLPLQTWLPDAMAGPTPVSALIHAATMVTAGVYLIARTHVLYDLAPPVRTAVAVIGALTLLLAGFSALNQKDIKRILAYSTISQIGYMFLALGVGAWSAAIFHFMTHAFFKSLLFLAAGVVVQLLTAIYTFRPVFVAFFGDVQIEPAGQTGYRIAIPLVMLSVLALTAGFVELPPYMGNVPSFTNLMHTALPASPTAVSARSSLEPALSAITSVTVLLGLGVAYVAFRRRPAFVQALIQSHSGVALQHFWETDWGMDWLYDRTVVRPFVWLAQINRTDVIDAFYGGLARLAETAYGLLSSSQTGQVRWYAAGIAAGSAIILIIAVLA